MPLEPGHTLLHYRLAETIGEGGMGVVWRAEDTTLGRDVAIKVLPDAFATDDDRLARLEREARLLASLNHPNIAAVYGFHEAPVPGADGARLRFIAMELVEGPTLADRLARSPLSLDEAMEIGRQLAEALEAAHERGVVHRDLKPSNVKVRPDGSVKVLDFGLARTVSGDASEVLETRAPTAAAATEPGVVLGTVPYMSPEQARGAPVDKRTDVWALGCVLYECLSGRKPFRGDSPTDVLAQIVTVQPDFDALPRSTPDALARLVRRCLEKDPRRRLSDAGEARFVLAELQTDPGSALLGASPAPARPGATLASLLPWALVVVLGAVLGFVVVGRGPAPAETASASGWSIALPDATRVDLPSPGGVFDYSRTVAISPDGTRVAFSVVDDRGHTQLYVKEAEPTPRPIPGTKNGRGPFFSPDGAWLGFHGIDSDAIYKVPLSGGSPQKICDVGRLVSFDATWSPDGRTIVFATDDGLWRVSPDGGSAEQLTVPDADRGEVGHHAPRFTSDGRAVLFTVSETPETHLALLSLDTMEWTTIARNAALGVPLPDRRMVFARAGELLVAPYDAGSYALRGSTVPVLQGIETTPGLGGMVLTQFDVSKSGTLAYVPAAVERSNDRLLWVDHDGAETTITSGRGTWVHPRLSPDGRRISLDIHSPDGMRDVYVYDLARGQMRALTTTGITWESEWRPDGARIATLSGAPAGRWSLFWVPSDFSAPPELIHRSNHAVPATWTRDGRTLLFHELFEGGIWRLSPGGSAGVEAVLNSPANERFPALSPDGGLMAFVADESGRPEVFVQSYPGLGPRHRISIEGGTEPRWSPDGRRIFFRRGDAMLAVDVATAPTFRAGRPDVLFSGTYDAAPKSGHQHYDISRDGRRFLMIRHGETIGPTEVHVIVDWVAGLPES